ncbi:beta-carotene hydroxylase, partial [Sesbania bispinosa]
MAAGLSATITLKPLFRLHHQPLSPLLPKSNSSQPLSPLRCFHHSTTLRRTQRMTSFTVCVLMEDPKQGTHMETE